MSQVILSFVGDKKALRKYVLTHPVDPEDADRLRNVTNLGNGPWDGLRVNAETGAIHGYSEYSSYCEPNSRYGELPRMPHYKFVPMQQTKRKLVKKKDLKQEIQDTLIL